MELFLCLVLAGCATVPEVPYTTGPEREAWMQGIGTWQKSRPEYANYVIKPGFGGPSPNEQAAKREALRDAYQQFGGALNPTQLRVIEDKTIQKTSGGRYFWYADVYVGYDNSHEDLRSVLTRQLSTLQNSLPKLEQRRSVLTAVGWPSLVIGVASAAMAVVSYSLGTAVYDDYDIEPTTPGAIRNRQDAERWSFVFTASAAGATGLPVGSVLLLIRSDVARVEQQIDKITGLLSSPPLREEGP